MKYGILITHGNLGYELIKTAEMIAGKISNINFISNNGLSLEGLIDKIEEIIKQINNNNIILMVEMKGGSTYMAARKVIAQKKEITMISGINFPMLISYYTKNQKYPTQELIEIMKQDALKGIEIINSNHNK